MGIRLIINGAEMVFPEDKTYKDIVSGFEKEGSERVLLVQENYRLRELYQKPKDGATVKLLTLKDKDGHKAYQRSICLVMLRAFEKVCGEDEGCHVMVHYSAGDGLYCTLKDKSRLSRRLLDDVTAAMTDIVDRALVITKSSVPTEEAVSLFKSRHMKDKEQLFRYRLSSRTNIYELDGFKDYFYGYMVYDTSYLKVFGLELYSDGFILRYPRREAPGVLSDMRPGEKLFGIRHESLKWGESLGITDVGDLNDLIVKGGGKELILIQEAYHEKLIAEAAKRIASDPEKKLVMIAGPSSSGKTTFSHRLTTQLSVYGLKPHPIPVDDYFVEREKTPLNPDGSYNFECLEAIDVKQFNKDMLKLLSGEETELPSFNFKTGKREYKGKKLRLGQNDILVIEGIHCLNDKLSYSLPSDSKFKIYISALTQINVDEHNRISTTDGRLLRRMVRDARTRGARAEDTISMWPSVRNGEENYIFPFQEEADFMFNSALIYELSVLKVYAKPLLFGIDQDSPQWLEAKRLLKFLDYVVPMSADHIPNNSLLREFVGGSCFDV